MRLHILADKKTGKIAGFRVTSEHTGDSKKFVPLVKEASKKNKIAKVYGDTAYDARKNFNLLDQLEINRARDQDQEERENAVQRFTPQKGRDRPHEEARSRRMDGRN